MPLVVGETADWQELREAGRQIKAHVLRHLDEYLAAVRGELHARGRPRALGRATPTKPTADRLEIIESHGEREVIKVKTMTSDETRLNAASRQRASRRSRRTSPI